MSVKSALGAVVLAAAVVAAPLSLASASDLVQIESKRGVRETVDALVQNLSSKGINIAARVDHAASAKAFGLELAPSEVVIFGNPKLGTPLMQANPAIALDLPMRIAVWQAADGKVYVAYRAPAAIAAAHGITGKDDILGMMTGALDGLSKGAAGVK